MERPSSLPENGSSPLAEGSAVARPAFLPLETVQEASKPLGQRHQGPGDMALRKGQQTLHTWRAENVF